MNSVIGLGNALLDIMTRIDSDSFLEKYSLKKGSMQLVDETFSKELLKATLMFEQQLTSGGSAANTIHGLARLGIRTGFVGKVGDDHYGEVFLEDMKNSGISPVLLKGSSDTGRVVALISPDSERTMATYLGAAVEQTSEDLTDEMFSNFSLLHIEGYLVQNQQLILDAVKLAKSKGLSVSLDCASFNVVEANRAFLLDLIKNYVDIVFANEEEAIALTGKQPAEAVDDIALLCPIAVVKIGKNGSLIASGKVKYQVPAVPAQVIDTTGAGDLYAAGFLYGWCRKLPLKTCAEIGSLVAAEVIQTIGAKIGPEKWDYIQSQVEARVKN